jgi:dethiobiotin synthetase
VLWPRGIRLPRPLSPHLSARLSGQPIVLDDLMAMPSGEPASTCWIIEGAGGVLVPLNATHLMAHLMVRLCLPILIVARSTLGTINHTLLTLEALRARSLDVAGVVMVGERNPANREAIEHYGRVAVVGELPTLNPLTPDALHAWAVTSPDPGDRLFHRCFT